jgi:hypothetical protein
MAASSTRYPARQSARGGPAEQQHRQQKRELQLSIGTPVDIPLPERGHRWHNRPGRHPAPDKRGYWPPSTSAAAQHIKPSGQAKSGRSIVGEFGKAVALTDKGEVPFALTSKVKIALEGRTLLQTEFADQESRYRAGDFDIGAGKGAKKSGRSQHEREAEAIVVATQSIGDLPSVRSRWKYRANSSGEGSAAKRA